MKRIILAALGLLLLTGCALSTPPGKPYTRTACSAVTKPQVFRTCLTVSGSGQYVTSVNATYTVYRTHLQFSGWWTFTGYGAISGATWGTATPLWSYAGYSLNPEGFALANPAQSYHGVAGQICSSLNEGNFGSSTLRARACVTV